MSPALAALALGLAAASPTPRTRLVSALVKVRPGSALPPEASPQLSAARGECEGIQLEVLPPAAKVTVAPLHLTGAKGTLTARLYREAYVKVTTASNSEGATGLWPDPLIPVEDAYEQQERRAFPADSTPTEPLVVYVEFCVPEPTPAGLYRGALHLSAAGQALPEVPLALAVQPFALPATSSLPNTFGLSLYSLAKGHALSAESADARRLLRNYMRALLTHRLSAHGLTYEPPRPSSDGESGEVDFAAYDAELGPFLDGSASPNGARFTTTDLREPPKGTSPEARVAFFRAFAQHFIKKGWKARLFYYAKDEPKPADYPLVQAQAKAVHAAQASLRVLITSSPNPDLDASADILCPVLNCFFPRPGPATCTTPQSRTSMLGQLRHGAEIWWYQSCMSHGCDGGPDSRPEIEAAFRGWASYMVDHPAPLNRAMGVLAFATGVDGELYFDTLATYETGDPWRSVFAYGGNGDGTLFYPGIPARLGGTRPFPVESLRLKTIRDGLEDYEYLQLLRARGKGDFARARAHQLARSGFDIEQDPAVWAKVRTEMTEALGRAAP